MMKLEGEGVGTICLCSKDAALENTLTKLLMI